MSPSNYVFFEILFEQIQLSFYAFIQSCQHYFYITNVVLYSC